SQVRRRRSSWQSGNGSLVKPRRVERRGRESLWLDVDRLSRGWRGTSRSRRSRYSGTHTGRVNICQASWARKGLAREGASRVMEGRNHFPFVIEWRGSEFSRLCPKSLVVIVRAADEMKIAQHFSA